MSKNRKVRKKRKTNRPRSRNNLVGKMNDPPYRLGTVQQVPSSRGSSIHQVDAESGRQGAPHPSIPKGRRD